MNEYVLISGKQAASTTVIYYCLFCGGSLPKSRREEFFAVPSDEELVDATRLLTDVTDVSTMRLILGEPDEVFDWWTDETGELIRNPDAPVYKRQYRYVNRWKTLQVTIQEYEGGHLRFAIHGQPKDSDLA
jgi:hypothetical protein